MRTFKVTFLVSIVASVLTACGGGSTSGDPAATGSATASGVISNSGQPPAGAASTPGTITLGWTPPTMNVDGTALTNLSGYKIYYGTNAAALDQSVTVSDAAATSYKVQGLSAGVWYFAVEAVTNVGTESSMSDVASATIT